MEDRVVTTAFGPPGLSPEALVRLADQTLDATALLGVSHASMEDIATARLAESIQHMARSQLTSQTGLPLGGQLDTGWKYNKRNTLLTVKDQEELKNRVSALQSGSHLVLEQVQTNLSLVLHQAGYSYADSQLLAASSVYFHISQDVQAAYIGLHLYLLTVSVRQGFTYADLERKHHAKKLKRIRDLYTTRLQVVLHSYAYLRDLQANKWQSFSTQQLRIQSLTTQVRTMIMQGDGGDGDGGDGTSTPGTLPPNPTCSHCKTSLHPGGKRECFWKDKSAREARAAAKRAAQNLAQLVADS